MHMTTWAVNYSDGTQLNIEINFDLEIIRKYKMNANIYNMNSSIIHFILNKK